MLKPFSPWSSSFQGCLWKSNAIFIPDSFYMTIFFISERLQELLFSPSILTFHRCPQHRIFFFHTLEWRFGGLFYMETHLLGLGNFVVLCLRQFPSPFLLCSSFLTLQLLKFQSSLTNALYQLGVAVQQTIPQFSG